jgi:S-adenosylmethionine:tRNA ribosyltransferase-isomerase
MQLSDFDYVLPKELIAQDPLDRRDASRLLVLHRDQKKMEDRLFSDIASFLRPGDVLVFNNSKVLPARIVFHQKSHDGIHERECEIFYLREIAPLRWEALIRPGKMFRKGDIFEMHFAGFSMRCTVISVEDSGTRILDILPLGENAPRTTFEILDAVGTVPLPPYIQKMSSLDRYQTLYAKVPGSVAAPTAGLHFTNEIFQALDEKGVQREYVTLHVGACTFLPVQTENIADHRMHEEWFSLAPDVCARLNDAKREGRRVIAVGTTACRTLESAVSLNSPDSPSSSILIPQNATTKLFITPGYQFHFIDGLITNFHLPKSTLLMLVSALAGRDFILDAYHHAIAHQYRFFSFGDAMFIE